MNLQRKWLTIGLTVSAVLYALPLMAAEAGEEAGLPQLDTSLFPAQLFWLAVSFTVLYVLMRFVALPGVKKTQDNRHHVISSELSSASAANEAARSMVAQYERALADARAKAQATVSDITAQAAKDSVARQLTQQQELSKRLSDAEASIRAVRDTALNEIKGSVVELAYGIVEKVTGLKVKA
jgi:F-type H+-transporting ATPase subunit b